MADGIGIVSTGYYLPPTRKRVDEVFRDESFPDTSPAAGVDFRRDIGIEAVHLAADEPPSALALEASRRALADADVDAAEIDLVVDFTSIPEDYVAPTWSAAGLVQHELGAERALAIAVNTGGCASYHVALKAACAMMRADAGLRTALLFAGDKTPALNKTYFPITVTCDGGSALVLRRGHRRRTVLAVEVATVGALHDVWYIPGITNPEPGEPVSEKLLHMKSDLELFAKNVIPINLFMFRRVMSACVKRAGAKLEEVDYFVYPTFSAWDLRGFCQGMRIAPQKVYADGLGRHGHIQENDMVVNYHDADAEGLIADGDLVMVTTNGAGFTWGAALVRH
jgi:3-oxoacyl-[acyl-carrier-protein] synthase-3